MKNNMKALFCILLIIAFSFSLDNQALGQEKVNITAGLGFPEMFNLGVRYQLEQVQIGISAGYIPGWVPISVATSLHYHFGGVSRLSNRRPWFVRMGLGYHDDLYLNYRIGRDFNISRKIGFEIGLGVSWDLPRTSYLIPTELFHSTGVAIFYRI